MARPDLRLDWLRLPTAWIHQHGLAQFRWNKRDGSAHIAALQVLIGVAHRADQGTGKCRLTYDDLEDLTGLSRKLISAGLKKLIDYGVIIPKINGRSTYFLKYYYPDRGWVKIPFRRIYNKSGQISFSLNSICARKQNYLR